MQPFNQPPPALGNQLDDDRAFVRYLERTLPVDVWRAVEPELRDLGELAGGELYRMQLADRENEPQLTTWSAWGERVDHIEVSPLWKHAERIAAERGLVATAYERRHGALSRVHQFALVHLFGPSTDIYSCPLAMTDGAARTLLESGHAELVERAVPRLTSRDPARFWTSGQWMTESTGGSDVGLSETVARQDAEGAWRLHGRKWFTSATTSPMALTLARPEGNGPGGRGLALFYVETRDARGGLQNIEILRLKDKLGTRKVPTAELMLRGTPAIPVRGLDGGVRNIAPMLNVTRTWNAVSSVCGMRRGIALARDYARRRVAFGAPLSAKPLHLETLAGLQAEYEGALQLAFRTVELIGRAESREATEDELALLRLLTPIAKLTTAKQAVAVASEVLELFGGAGYVEDTGLPVLLRDAQVLPIWEGTTNVLSLDVLRGLGHDAGLGGLLVREATRLASTARDAALVELGARATSALERAGAWLRDTMSRDPLAVEAGARHFALTLGRSLELALLVRQAQHDLDTHGDGRARAAALRFARERFELLVTGSRQDAAALAMDEALPRAARAGA
jgi:alkylation response protein AidB-like acyl-CoA dehydrogenase